LRKTLGLFGILSEDEMGSTGIGSGVMEIAGALLAITLIALLLNKSNEAATLVTSSSDAFAKLLQTVSMQNGMGINF
jgi:hypothetical protein